MDKDELNEAENGIANVIDGNDTNSTSQLNVTCESTTCLDNDKSVKKMKS